jgi:Predicted phage phi-C31 gp36 major capsid-like protein
MKTTAREIRQERAEVLKQARAITSKASDEKRELTVEERGQFDSLMEKATNMEADAKRLESLEGAESLVPVPGQEGREDPNIGMSTEEIEKYSLVRAVRAAASNDWSEAGLEREASRAAAKRMGVTPEGFIAPYDVLSAPRQKRAAMNVGAPTGGGDLVATELHAESMIDVLRARNVLAQAGATFLTGLVGEIAIPRKTSATAPGEKAETTAGDESEPGVDQVTMSPKKVTTYSEYSRMLMMQSSVDVETFLRDDLAKSISARIGVLGLHGSGSPSPLGVAGVTGIGSVVGGATGAAPTWANIIGLETEVAVDNADIGSLAYIVNAVTRGYLKGTPKVSGIPTFMWNDQAGDTPLNGYKALVTNQVSNSLTKSTGTGLSAIFFGNWADLLIGMWGGLDLLVNPYAKDTQGIIRITVHQFCDVAVRHPESFAAMLDAKVS